jgi:cytochrome b involved in lipid metabolism
MKKLCYSTFIAFWSSVATMLALHALATEQGTKPGAGSADRVYTLAEVQQHNKLDDCWMAIEGNVYDVTAYVDKHPTPPSVLQPWCGAEATEGMRTKGYGNDHSPAAWEMLKDFRIGKLAQ